MKLRNIPGWFWFLLIQFLILLGVFSAFRFSLYLGAAGDAAPELSGMLPDAFFRGISYDVMVGSYLLVLPALAGMISMFTGEGRWLGTFYRIAFILIPGSAMLASAADLPYYRFSGSRLDKALLMWTDTPGEMLGFVLKSPAYYGAILLFIAGTAAWSFVSIRMAGRLITGNPPARSAGNKMLIILSVMVLMMTGIRGGLRHRPVAIRDAFVSNNPAVNLLPLNPLHTFFDSFVKVRMDVLDDETARNNTIRWLNAEPGYSTPFPRHQKGADTLRPNIILILMESLTAGMTGLSESGKSFTPFLDSLAERSVSFQNLFASGVHTSNGIYGTLYSMPSVPGEHPLSNQHMIRHGVYGAPDILKEKGYSTMFFCTHHEEFDNMGYFLRKNGFSEFYSRKDYPDRPDEGPFGVSDESLYELAIRKLSEKARSDKPFFASLLTISTHEPPALPKRTAFRPESDAPLEQVFEYADWALGNFIRRCAKEPWFSNTVFVIAADHGYRLDSPYEMPLSFHHSPCLFFAPKIFSPEEIEGMAIQPDIFPTLFGKLGFTFINSGFGMDLSREKRPYAYFCKDYLAGCLDSSRFLIVRKFGGESLHAWREGSGDNRIDQEKVRADSMRVYLYSMLQSARWVVENGKTVKPQRTERP